MSNINRHSFSQFSVPAVTSEEVGWRSRLSKWQWALVIGVPLAAAAALAGVALVVGVRRRRRSLSEPESPQPSLSPTPVASPTATAAKKPGGSEKPGEKPGEKAKSSLDQARDMKQEGNELYKQGKFEEAAQCYEEAIRLSVGEGEKDSVVAIYHQNLAAVYDALVKKDTDPDQKTSHCELVIQNCDSAVALNPRYVKALLRRFKMYQTLGHKEEALLDVTRVLLLDENQAQGVSQSVTELLRDLSQAQAAKTFPEVGPLAPTKYLVKTYSDSFIWKDDLSEEGLKVLWLSAQSPPTDQSESVDSSHDTPQGQPVQEASQHEESGNKEGEGAGEGEEGGEGGGEAEGEGQGKGEGEGQGQGEGEGYAEGVADKKGEGDGNGMGEEGEGENGQGREGVIGEEGDKEEREEGEEKEEEKEGGGEGEETIVVTVEGEGGGSGEGKKVNSATGEVEGGNEEEDTAMVAFADELFVQAAARYQRYDLTGLLDLLTQAIEEGHKVFRPHALLLRGSLHALWRMDSQALRDLQEVINTQNLPNVMYVNALIKKAGIFAGGLKLDKCKTCFEKAVAIMPDSTDIFVHRARVSLETEEVSNLATVVGDLEKAVRAAPDRPYPLYSLASTFHRMAGIQQSMQMVEKARSKFQEAIKKFPKFADGLILYALFLQDISDFQQAEEVLNKVVQIEPENPLGHFSLGLLQLVVRSDLNQTMVHMQKAIAVDISCVQAYDTIASIEMQRGNTARAMELYDKAVRYSRNQVEMTQAYVAQKVFAVQERVCKEYGVPINQLSRSAPPHTAQPAP